MFLSLITYGFQQLKEFLLINNFTVNITFIINTVTVLIYIYCLHMLLCRPTKLWKLVVLEESK